MRIVVHHDIDDLANDCAAVARGGRAHMAAAVRKNVEAGQRLAQNIARAKSGPHGRLYYKRITSEMTNALQGEYGPTGAVAGNAVGAGWRSGPRNTDLPQSADVIGPKLAKDVGDAIDGLFW